MARDPNARTGCADTPPDERAALSDRAGDHVVPIPSAYPITPEVVLMESLEAARRGEVDRLVILKQQDGEIAACWSNMSPGELALFQRRLGHMVDDLIENDEMYPGEEESETDDER